MGAGTDAMGGAASGAAAGSVAGPYGTLIGAGIGALGSIFGGKGASDAAKKAAQAQREAAEKANNVLTNAKGVSDTAFSPYTTAGSTGSAGELASIQGRQQAQKAIYNPVTAQGAQEYLDPSAQYQMAQANKATQASALAKGGMGGGLAKALSNNSAKMAQTYWTQAQQNQLAAKNQNFNQQDTNYQRDNAYQQSQIDNYGNIANRGLTATGANQTLQEKYNQGISDNITGAGTASANRYANQGQIFSNTASNVGNTLGSAAASIDWSKLFGQGTK